MGPSSVIMTYTGKFVDLLHPEAALVDIRDIAHALSQINRFTGHTEVPYSVADHCLLASYSTIGDPLVSLLHDAAEAYLDDVASPLKKRTLIDLGSHTISYTLLESLHLVSIGEALGCPRLLSGISPGSKEGLVDHILLIAEAQVLMGADGGMPAWREIFNAPPHLVEQMRAALRRRVEEGRRPSCVEAEYLSRYAELVQDQKNN